MKYQIILIRPLSILCCSSIAQDIPACIEKLANNSTQYNTVDKTHYYGLLTAE